MQNDFFTIFIVDINFKSYSWSQAAGKLQGILKSEKMI